MEEETEEPGRPSVFQVLVRTFRALRGWRRDEYAAKAEIHPKTVYRCETSGVIPKPATLGKMAAAVDLTMPFIEVCLVPALEAARAASAPFDDEAFDDLKKAGAELDSALSGTCRSAIGLLVQELEGEDREPWERNGSPCEADRLEAADAWERLATCDAEDRRFLVETCREFHTWAVAERLCHASEDAASDTAEGALELAELACKVAELAPCKEPLRSRLRGYTLAFRANAYRVKTDLKGAKEDFARVWRRWQEGGDGERDLLAEWRLLDLEASLCRDDRRFAEALELHDRATASSPREASGRILLKKATTFMLMGETEQAIVTLREAAQLVDSQREPHRLYGLKFNLATSLCDLERYAEAERLLPEVEELAGALRKELDQVRVVWLSGKVSAGLGRTAEAEAAFEQVRQEGHLPRKCSESSRRRESRGRPCRRCASSAMLRGRAPQRWSRRGGWCDSFTARSTTPSCGSRLDSGLLRKLARRYAFRRHAAVSYFRCDLQRLVIRVQREVIRVECSVRAPT